MTLAPDRPATRTVADLPAPRAGWWRDVACRPGMNMTALRRACERCPVLNDCLLDAVKDDDQATFRAGRYPEDRNDWLAQQGILRTPKRQSNAVPRGPKPRPKRVTRGQGVHRPDLDSAELYRLHEDGWTYQQLAERYECARDTIVSRVRAHRRAVEAGQA